jgi:serine/threonine-protein kinase
MVRQIGRGGFGAVYLARDEELDRDVAIKLLHASLTHRADLVSRVRREGRALARVRHPNVVMVFDVEEHEGRLGLCMEYIRGRTLDELVRSDGPLNEVEAVAVGQAVCRALAAIHQTGVLHRDVKARNVMRERAGRIVLMDLGATVDIALQDPRIDLGVGTPAYMAPELLEGQVATPRSEVYAVGVLLYFLVTGEYPVAGSAIDELREAHRHGRRRRLDEHRFDLPASFVRIVERATSKDPAERFESPVALLREMSEEPPRLKPDPGPTPPDWVGIVRRTLQVVVGLAAIGVLAGVLTNRTFNNVIDRPAAFDPASFPAQVWLGMRSLILPAALFAIMAGASTLLQLALPIWPRLTARVPWQRLIALAGRPGEEPATILARLVVAAGFIALLVLFVVFNDVVYAFTNTISEDSLERFVPWRERSDFRTLQYRVSYTAALFLMAAGWKAVNRVRLSTGGGTPGSVRAAGIAVAGLLIAFLVAPHKLSIQNDMPVALVSGQRCYLLGERRAGADEGQVPQSLVYCPAWSVPRVRTLSGAVEMKSCGFAENVFLLSSATDCTPMAEP